MAKGIVDANFVRQEYYLDPPTKGSSAEAWDMWQKADDQAAAIAKRKHTMSLKHAELPDYLQDNVMVKRGGIYRQGAMVGFVGSADDGTVQAETAIEATQEFEIDQAHARDEPKPRRGGKSRNRAARQRRARREAKRKALGFN